MAGLCLLFAFWMRNRLVGSHEWFYKCGIDKKSRIIHEAVKK